MGNSNNLLVSEEEAYIYIERQYQISSKMKI